jgi:hypothetical protein
LLRSDFGDKTDLEMIPSSAKSNMPTARSQVHGLGGGSSVLARHKDGDGRGGQRPVVHVEQQRSPLEAGISGRGAWPSGESWAMHGKQK